MQGSPVFHLIELIVGVYLLGLGFKWVADPVTKQAHDEEDPLEKFRIFFKIGGLATVIHALLSSLLVLMV